MRILKKAEAGDQNGLERAKNLIAYVLGETGAVTEETVNMSGVSSEAWIAEMGALAEACRSGKGVLDHWLFLWPEGEIPAANMANGVVKAFLKAMGLEGHQAVLTLVVRNGRAHMHVIVNRVSPETKKYVRIEESTDDLRGVAANLAVAFDWALEPTMGPEG